MMHKHEIRYYITECDKLIKLYCDHMTYVYMNTISTSDKRLTKSQFDSFRTKQLKKCDYNKLMNEFFKTVEHEWTHNGDRYRKLENFVQTETVCDNYALGNQIHYHSICIANSNYKQDCIVVYYRGRIFYHTLMYQGDYRGQLIDMLTLKRVGWTSLKNCAPIVKLSNNKIQ